MVRLKGYKTIVINTFGLLLTLGDYFNSFPWSTFIDDKHKLLVYTMTFGVGNLILRSMTTTPVFNGSDEPKKDSDARNT